MRKASGHSFHQCQHYFPAAIYWTMEFLLGPTNKTAADSLPSGSFYSFVFLFSLRTYFLSLIRRVPFSWGIDPRRVGWD